MYKRQRKTLALMLANNSGVSRKSELLSRTSLYEDFTYSDTLDSRITATRASTKTYFNSSGVLSTAAINEFPREYDPSTLKCLGRSFWEARTNLLTYSEQMDNAAWVKSGTTVSANAVTAPDGTLTVDKLVETTAGGEHYAYQLAALTSGVTYTGTLFVKAGERTKVRLQASGAAFSTYAQSNADFDLSLGTVTAQGSLSLGATITAVGGGIYRCSLTVAAVATSTGGIFPILRDNSSTVYTGDGTSGLYIWGAQLEAGATPTPYIPTTTAAATRAADVVSMTGTNFSSWYNQTEGTFLVTTMIPSVGGSDFPMFVMPNDNSGSNAMHINYRGSVSNPRAEVYVGGVSQATLNGSNIAVGSTLTQGFVYKVNDFALSANGAVATTDTSGTIPTVDRMQIGSYRGTGNFANGFISRITYWPVRLSNTDLQILSRST